MASCLSAAGAFSVRLGWYADVPHKRRVLGTIGRSSAVPGWLGAAGCATDVRKAASDDHIARAYDSSANGLLQHGHSPSYPLTRAENAVGCGKVVIALNASGARCA